MRCQIQLEKLKPHEIVGLEMDKNRVLHIWFNYPILNAEVDYKTALYARAKQKELEAINGKCLGLLMNINNYKRLDCVEFFGISLPSTKVRKLHNELFRDSILKRMAIFKKEAPRSIEVCARMVMFTTGKEIKVFSDQKKAAKWLEEGVQKCNS